ncbi:hypothetical protein [Nostoc commune]|uniref:hypothetical protein n=1 Tax=Nostoc commune TaxID=1178 RepID=UPI0011B1C639|nr:hypothetical protein [Nostoc commune]
MTGNSPTTPVMGATTCLKPRLTCAAAVLAWAWRIFACACRTAAPDAAIYFSAACRSAIALCKLFLATSNSFDTPHA